MNRLGLVIGQLSWGGAERQLHELATRIQAEGFVPTVYCLSEDIEPYGPMLRIKGIPVRVFPRRSHFDLGRAWALRRALAADEVDLAHAWLVNDDAYTALAHIGGPRPWVASMRSRPLDRDGLRKRIDRWTFRRADRVVVNESEVIDFLERELGCPRSKVTLIPNGVDFERLLGSRSREAVRSELNTPLDSLALQFAGRLEGVKNLPLLLDAFSRIVQKGVNAFLWVSGDGSLRESLEDLSRSLGLGDRVRFTGVRKDLPDLLRAADLFVLCSISEGLPNVVLEAMGCGTPALVTKGCGCGDLIRTGENGWIAARATPEALAADLEAILGDRDALTSAGRNAAEHVRSCYSVEAMVSRMALLYREILTDFRAG